MWCRASILLLLAHRLLFQSPATAAGSQQALAPQPTATAACGYQHCLWANNTGSGEGSLYQALKKAQLLRASLEIRMSGRVFNLSHNQLLSFENWSNLSLAGAGSTHTVLHCDERGVGLVFRNSSHVTLRGFTLKHCARPHNTTSVYLSSFTDSDPAHSQTPNGTIRFVESRSAMLFNFCSNLTLDEVQVFNSSGMGVTLYNSNGSNLFKSSQFISNHLNADDSYFGGGGVVVETSHCVPGDISCRDDRSELETQEALYVFRDCMFGSNRATSHNLPFDSVYPRARRHVGLGRGGGLAVIFKGRSLGNKVLMDHCTFMTNRAEWGGAVYLAFGDTSVGNSVSIRNRTQFSLNNFRGTDESDVASVTVGGALRAEFVSYPPDPATTTGYVSNVSGNSIVIQDCNFDTNFATWGGGVSLTSTRDVPGQMRPNSVRFQSCHFRRNQANIVGSAMDLSSWKPDVVGSAEPYMQPLVRDCTFDSNQMVFNNITDYPVGLGAVYLAGLPLRLQGSIQFEGNIGTGMVVSQTYVSVLDASSVSFTGNSGRRGGALALVGDAWLVAGEGASFLFDRNSVGTYGLGGAVYSIHFDQHDLAYQQSCFFRYHKFGVPPSEWNATFVFRENTADHKPNSIYTTSSQPCAWQSSETLSVGHTPGAFCESSTWVFEGEGRNCSNEIATGPRELVVSQIDIDVVPGWKKHLGVSALNDFGQKVPPVLTASPASDSDQESIAVADSTSYVIDDQVEIYGEENSEANLLLTTLDPRVVASKVRVRVLPCPPGFRPVACGNHTPSLVGKTCSCVCVKAPGIYCNDSTREAYLLHLHCISVRSPNSSQLVVSSCPYNHRRRVALTRLTLGQLDDKICKPYHRTGYLCSHCIDGYGVAINTFDYGCVKCREHGKYDWALFLLLELVPITLVCFLVILLDVSVTSPALNALVFFSQIVSVTYSTNFSIWFFGVDSVNRTLAYPLLTLYGISNLEFFRNVFPKICLHENLGTLNVLVINYVKALYPMLLLCACYICVQLYDRNFRPLHCLWRPFRKCLKSVYRSRKPRTSIIDAFATLIVLSYSKFMYVSFPLVNLISVYELGGGGADDNGSNASHSVDPTPLPHRYYFNPAEVLHNPAANIAYFILGTVVLVVFVGCPPLFLLLYPLRAIQHCIGRLGVRTQIALRTFADSFVGDFRDGTEDEGGGGKGRDCRCFAGLYLVLRIVFLTLYIVTTTPTVLYLVQQILCTLGLLLFAVARPYKVDFYNQLDAGFFALMAVLNSLSFYNSHHEAITIDNSVQKAVFYVNYILMYLPLLYLAGLVLYQVLTIRGCLSRAKAGPRKISVNEELLTDNSHVSSSEEGVESMHESDRLLPDRFVNPQNYRTLDRFSSGRSYGSRRGRGHEEEGSPRQPSTDQPQPPPHNRQTSEDDKRGVTV